MLSKTSATTPFCLSFDAPTNSETKANAAQKIGEDNSESIKIYGYLLTIPAIAIFSLALSPIRASKTEPPRTRRWGLCSVEYNS